MKIQKCAIAILCAAILAFVGLAGAPQGAAGFAPGALATVRGSPANGLLNWILADDFRVWPDQANPNPDSFGNPDTWSFLWTTAAHNPSTYALITVFYPNAGGIPGEQGWVGPEPVGEPNSGAPVLGMNTTGVPLFSSNTSHPPGVILTHPDSTQPAIVGWHSPFTGSVAITGGVTDMSTFCGDGILWYIDKNSSTVASGSYPNGGAQLFQDGTNGSQLANLPVTKGDFIYFLIAPGGDYCADGTQLDVTIKMISVSRPDVPALTGPANNSTVPRSRVRLNWSDVAYATRYQVVVEDAALNTLLSLTVYGASQIKFNLPRHQTYHWYVQACNTGGCSDKSETWQFEN